MPGYTVQVAAYQTRAPAQALVDLLKERGLQARIAGAQAPYRVRVGRYTTEARAGTEARALKAKGITGFVTEAEPVMP
jgi:cell division protein FtsN